MTDTDIIEAPKPKRARKTTGQYKPARAKKPRTGVKYDWDRIRIDYIEGIKVDGNDDDIRDWPTLEQVAAKHSVPHQRVRERSAQERWTTQRQEYQRKIALSRTNKRITRMANEAVEFDAKALTTAKLGMAMVTARIGEIAKEVQEHNVKREQAKQLQAEGYDVEIDDLKTVIDARELNTLGNAALAWQALGMKALGTDIQRTEVSGTVDVDVEVTSIAREMSRDDPERLAAFLVAAQRSGLFDQQTPELTAVPDIEDAVVIEEGS